MNSCVPSMILVTTLCIAAHAGTVSGKVSGVSGVSVVYIDAIPGKTFPPATQSAVMAQSKMAFQPHVLAIQQGTTVKFANRDSVLHNVFWPSVGGNKKLSHNLGSWPRGETRTFKFDAPGVAPLLCNAHSDMSGYIVVAPTPYFAVTNEAGEYKIEGVPVGKYTLTVWHEGNKTQSQPGAVAGDAKVDFTLK